MLLYCIYTVIKENAAYIKSIRYIKQWQQWLRRNCGSSYVWCFSSHLLPWASLPSLAASSHIVPIVPKSCPSMPGGASNRHVLCLSPLTNSEKSTALFTSRSRSNACTRHSGALPRPVYINSTCFGLGTLYKPIKHTGFNEGSQKRKGLVFHWYSPILHFFFPQLYLLRQLVPE